MKSISSDPSPSQDYPLSAKALRSCPPVHFDVFHVLVRDLAKKFLKVISKWESEIEKVKENLNFYIYLFLYF